MAQRVSVADGARKKTSRVMVSVRLRPFMNKQDEKGEGPCVRGLDSQNLEIVNWRNATETLKYHFDVFHGEQTTQQEVFLTSVKPILPHITRGQNASVFAYGPTGAGKTHTMLGSSEQPGVIPRALGEVFNLVNAQKEDEGWDYSIGMSYLEIYNEKVLDLLSPNSQDLPIREDKDKNILIPGLTHTTITSFSDFERHFVPASLNRTTASTKLNQRSSRSHAILLVKVVRTQRCLPRRQQTGKLYLVDLAGSEDNRRTGNQGIRLKESGAINLSLFTLSKVVDSLRSGASVRVPYRDSKLTRLLQDSLGGSAHSLMIVNIAPEYEYCYDTVGALNFAAKSKLIINKPFTQETIAVLPVKRAREEHEAGQSGTEPHKKKQKDEKKPEPHSLPQPSLIDRLLALEKRVMLCEGKERAGAQKAIQELKEEHKANLAKKSRNSVAPLQPRQVNVSKGKAQQVMVQPLLDHTNASRQLVVRKQSVCVKKETTAILPDGKENQVMNSWESQLDRNLLEQSRQKILQILNTGSLKELKSLHQIGAKKAELIMGWREVHGAFTKLEDLSQVDGMTEKRFSTFMKVNLLSLMAK
ncbi:kinesin-like protein KIF22 [Corythoichthys intestinalis]|uniref:kinesin-like protein KIF22 n=1 Tax=Corythoichthys intestinalis TaxID=161448 RepID=UPI0025A629FA|nr:kinesin-like protein KIF22 [Corythoichthys intestinalis]XP_057682437.1 kinesin-like protein KIF22 [Corythoichthys intestinalis]XP_057682438.1 kinesin-like protein KIF22 [Corythoichthys intestinalis]XP_057682439.1 kinesin-like protein KIF22 [Corythoichthys intestinalis]